MMAEAAAAPEARAVAAARRHTCLREKTVCLPISAHYFPD